MSYFAPSRGGGESAFGILEWGGCGYTNSEGGQPSLTWPKELVAAYSDSNDDSAGACVLQLESLPPLGAEMILVPERLLATT